MDLPPHIQRVPLVDLVTKRDEQSLNSIRAVMLFEDVS
jgi:hypothetical protein